MRLGWAAQGPAAILAPGPSRVPNAAAETRIVSGGRFGPAKGELSRDLRYMASARIPQFESYMRSHAVRLPTRPPILKAGSS